MRKCVCCGQVFRSVGLRVTHQNRCPEPVSPVLALLLHDHQREFHSHI